MTIDIKDIQGQTRVSVPIQEGAKGVFSLMTSDYIQLPFTSENVIPFKLGDYADLSGIEFEGLGGKIAKVYEIVDINNATPTYNETTGGYDYTLRLDAYYWKWKNKIFKYTPENAGQEASWSLTAALDVHLGVFLRNLKALGYTYKGTDFTFSIDNTVENKAVSVTYDNINLLDALFTLASEDYYNCDCWITDNVIHFGRNEFGDAVKIERGVEAASIGKSESKGTYATRIYAFGGTRNIPTNYRPTDEQTVVNGVVQKRLMLPAGTPYIDAYEGMTTEEAIEDVVVFDDIYPRRIGTMSDVTTRTETVTDEDGTEREVTYYRYKDTGLVFDEKYIIEGQELKIIFQSGKMNGMEFGVIFNPDDKAEPEQLWEIVANEDYGRLLPDDVIRPENGDTYVLSGFDIQLVSDQYIPEAEKELLERAKKYAEQAMKDDGTYPVTLYSDYVYEEQLRHNYEFGQKVNLIDDAYFPNGRLSRILGWEIKLDIPFDSPQYTVGESMPYSRIGEIEDKLDALTYKGQTYVGGGGSGVYVIKTNDSTAPSDSNVFSALRTIASFLRKDKEDETKFLIKFLGGLISDNIESQNFASGPFGTGFIIKRDPVTGKSYIEADEIYIRLKAYFDTLEIKHLSHVGGRVVLSPASMECTRVEVISTDMDALYDYNGEPLYDVESIRLYALRTGTRTVSVYRCYFKQSDDTKEIVNEFAVDDLAQCREFNVKENVSQNVTNQYYWRRVVSVGKDYIDLSVEDCDVGSMEPKAGDTIVTIGNKTNQARQHVVFLSSYDDDAPCIKLYSGINDYSTKNKEVTVISPNADKNVFTGKVVIKPGSSGFSNFEDAPDFDKLEQDLAEVRNLASDAQKAANTAQSAVGNLDDYIDGAFSDGIIEKSEAQAIEKYINTVNQTKKEVEATYNALYSNQYLSGTAKTNLLNAKVSFFGAVDSLIQSINTAISDGKTTSAEKSDVDEKFNSFNTYYASLSTAIENANRAIQDKVKELSKDEAVEEVRSEIESVEASAKDDLAKKLGYANFNAMVTAAEAGQTVISGGHINTKLIEADAIVTTELIASAIKTTTLNVNDKFIVEKDGTFRGVEGTLERMNINGAIRSPFKYDGFTGIIIGGQKKLVTNNIIVTNPSGGNLLSQLPGGEDYDGFAATIINYDSEEGVAAGVVQLQCSYPIWEDGVQKNSTALEAYEGIDIHGFSNGSEFIGWVVKNRFKLSKSTVQMVTITTRVDPPGSGVITGGGRKPIYTNGRIEATANEGYSFNQWSDGVKNNSRQVTWDEDKVYVAEFDKLPDKVYKLSVFVSPEGSATVKGAGDYYPGATAVAEVVPSSGYIFNRWDDGSTSLTRRVTMDSDKSFTAYLSKNTVSSENLLKDIHVNVEANVEGSVGAYYLASQLIINNTSSENEYSQAVICINKGYLGGKIKAGARYTLEFSHFGASGEEDILAWISIADVGNNPSSISSWDVLNSSASESVYISHNTSDSAGKFTTEIYARRSSTALDSLCFVAQIKGLFILRDFKLIEK